MRPGKAERAAIALQRGITLDAKARAKLVPDTPGRMRSAWDRRDPIICRKSTCGWNTSNAQRINATRKGGIANR